MKFYGQFDPPVDKILYEKYFKNKVNGTSIECGAYDGVRDSNTKIFEDNFNWRTINIEPLPNIFEKLKINRPNSINLEIALSDTAGEKTLTNYRHPSLKYDWGNASIKHLDSHKKNLESFCGKKNFITHQIKCKTYKELIDEFKINSLDLFSLDVEGHESEVIDGMVGCNVLPDVFVIEHGHRDVSFFVEKLKCLEQPYFLDFVSNVNSFFIKVKL